MKKIKYSPDYKEKIRELRKYLDNHYGAEVRLKILTELNSRVQMLKQHEKSGISVREALGVDSNYYYFYSVRNYVFYYFNHEEIFIVNVYNEKEDFMWKLFGIKTISEEREDYWGE